MSAAVSERAMGPVTGPVAGPVTGSVAGSGPAVVTMVHPMPGFPDARRFALERLDDAGTLWALRSLDVGGLQFLVVPPDPFFPGYAPELSDDTAAELGLATADDALVLLVLHAGRTLATTTANLRAPIVVNATTGRAGQVILDDAGLRVAAPLAP